MTKILIATKTCTKCRVDLPLHNFGTHKKTKSGICSWCKNCHNKESTKGHKAKRKTISGYLRSRVWGTKRNANQRGIFFNLTFDDLIELYAVQQGRCALSNEIMTFLTEEGHVLTNISIDRIDSTKGYTKDNIQLVCYIVNAMKNIMTKDELVVWCQKIINQQNK